MVTARMESNSPYCPMPREAKMKRRSRQRSPHKVRAIALPAWQCNLASLQISPDGTKKSPLALYPSVAIAEDTKSGLYTPTPQRCPIFLQVCFCVDRSQWIWTREWGYLPPRQAHKLRLDMRPLKAPRGEQAFSSLEQHHRSRSLSNQRRVRVRSAAHQLRRDKRVRNQLRRDKRVRKALVQACLSSVEQHLRSRSSSRSSSRSRVLGLEVLVHPRPRMLRDRACLEHQEQVFSSSEQHHPRSRSQGLRLQLEGNVKSDGDRPVHRQIGVPGRGAQQPSHCTQSSQRTCNTKMQRSLVTQIDETKNLVTIRCTRREQLKSKPTSSEINPPMSTEVEAAFRSGVCSKPGRIGEARVRRELTRQHRGLGAAQPPMRMGLHIKAQPIVMPPTVVAASTTTSTLLPRSS